MTTGNADASTGEAPVDWQRGLVLNAKDEPKKLLANVMHVLATHPDWSGVLAFDAFAGTVVALRRPPMRTQDEPARYEAGDWTDEDTARTAAWFTAFVGFEPATTHVEQAVSAIARKHEIHPVRDWLKSLHWDGTQRLPRLFVDYFGAKPSPYVEAVGERFMIGAVARVMKPGCKLDTAVVLEGPQGSLKSSACRALAGPAWFADTGITIGDKDSYQQLRRKWVIELAELSALKGREVERVKNFLSSAVDRYRPSYGRRSLDFPRQCVFIGSTNEKHYLIDPTGNRRFWPVACGTIDLEAIVRDREQLWAEAVVRFAAGIPWYLDTDELVAAAVEEQEEREQRDDWEDLVARWIALPTTDVSKGVTTLDVQLGAIGLTPDKINSGTSARVGHLLRKLGFEPEQCRVSGEYQRRERRYFRATCDVACDAPAAAEVPTSHVTGVTGSTNAHERMPEHAGRATERSGVTGATRDVDLDERIAIQHEGRS